MHVLPDPGGSSSSAVSRDECGEGFFRTFPRGKKSPKSAASPSPRVPARSSSWTPAAYAGGQAADYYFVYNGTLFKHAWDYQHQCCCWCDVRREDSHCFMPLYVPPFGSSSSAFSDLEPPRYSHGLVNLEPLGYKFMALWTVYEMACFFVTLDGNVQMTMHCKFQQSVQMTVVVPRPQFRAGHCSYVTETGTVCNCAEVRT